MNVKFSSTLGNYEKILKLRNYSENTINNYVHYVDRFLIEMDKSGLHITGKEIKEYIENFQYSSIAQQNMVYSSIKLFAEHILGIKQLDKIFLKRPRKEKHLPQIIEKEFLLEQISKITNLKHKAIISLGFSVGLRVSEVINLKIEDIDSKRMIINIRQAKGKKDRILPLSQTILKLLREYFKQYKPNVYLFNGQNSLKYSSESCNKIVKKYLGEQYHFHQLRHAAFTAMLESGIDLRIIQKLAGHSSSKTTEIYTHVSTNVLSKICLPI